METQGESTEFGTLQSIHIYGISILPLILGVSDAFDNIIICKMHNSMMSDIYAHTTVT
jgi:hypothetical protein